MGWYSLILRGEAAPCRGRAIDKWHMCCVVVFVFFFCDITPAIECCLHLQNLNIKCLGFSPCSSDLKPVSEFTVLILRNHLLSSLNGFMVS